ncbi:unnamed protein product [Nippostrongylus brasiliensis]|uniref:AraC family transcriptional regulator n=1 Tax=Nippostrongylus brasiliensis TaxID=27835 RepID=A0A0N4YMX7_NIPBR|nr:unnamed protein product [Nippostrongylus brasiliensis]
MALLPTSSFPGCVFLEARMLGQPATVVSQIGLSVDAPDCSVAVFCPGNVAFSVGVHPFAISWMF